MNVAQVLAIETMSPATCAVLAGVFPVVLLTVAVDRALISVKVRRLRWFRRLVVATVTASAVGLLLVVLGVQTAGLHLIWGLAAWGAFATAFVGLGASVLATVATHEVKEDRKKEKRGSKA